MRFVRWLGGFFEAHALQSMTRAVALLCALTGCIVALASPQHWQTVGTLIGGGAVALLTRNKVNGGGSSPSAPSLPSGGVSP